MVIWSKLLFGLLIFTLTTLQTDSLSKRMNTFLNPFQKIHDAVAIFPKICSNIKLLLYVALRKGDSQPSRKMIEGNRPLTEKS